MNSNEIRETFLAYFEGKGHLRVPSASLVPPPEDTSTLLTVAGMQPFKPYFEGREEPPRRRLASSQRSFRTVDIDVVGTTKRHLTWFEMLGNFSFGDYFKREAIAYGWELSLEGFGFDPERIWVTVFAGDEELGIGADEEAIELWREIGMPDERILRLPRSENFWQGGDSGPCGPSSEMYIDRGPEFGGDRDRPGDDTDRFLEYWNLVFTQYQLHTDGTISELPTRNIDTGLGLERMAVIQQGVDSVFDTDGLAPLVALAGELTGREYGADAKATRAMRILADHSRGAVSLLGDGVVPSNEDRGYVLRRIMRRAIQQGGVLGLEPPFLGRFAELAIELQLDANPDLAAERAAVLRWVGDEEESFGRTLERGSELLDRLIADAKQAQSSWIAAEDAFRLHDTYGFPYDLTRELLAEQGLTVDDHGFEELMEGQRRRARGAAGAGSGDGHEGHAAVIEFVAGAAPSSFVGYERLRAETSVAAAERDDERLLVKLEESPFYPEGGGQIADAGVVSWEGGEARVADVYRVGEDQALRVEAATGPGSEAPSGPAALEPGMRVEARVDELARRATERNHTATHLLHAALRATLGPHVRQAGSAVRPEKLRFDFTHGKPLEDAELRAVEDAVNEWIKESRPVRALEMARTEAETLGAMALFGEKYGEWVRMVEIDEVSRELCGGTHVRTSAEVGIFKIVGEASSAANVRRIEALTGPAAIDYFRERSEQLERAGALLGGRGEPLAAVQRAAERLAELEAMAREQVRQAAGEEADSLAAAAEELDGIKLVTGRSVLADQRSLAQLADRVRQKLGEGAVVLGGAEGGRVALVATVSPALVKRGVSAASVVREAAALVGGGGGGRDDSAQAGGRDPEALDDALAAARAAIERSLAG